MSWDVPTQQKCCQCPPGKPHWGKEGGFLDSEVQQLIFDLSEVTFKHWTQAAPSCFPSCRLRCGPRGRGVPWGSNPLPAHRKQMCGNGTADCSLPNAKPGGTARGEFQKPEEEKGGVGDRQTRGRSVLSQHRAVPQLTKARKQPQDLFWKWRCWGVLPGLLSNLQLVLTPGPFLALGLRKFYPSPGPGGPQERGGKQPQSTEHFLQIAPIPDTVMEEDISSGKFFQGQYFNELLNNDFILEAHSIFVQHCTRTKPLPDFSQQQTSPKERALHFGKQWWGRALPPGWAQGERLPWCGRRWSGLCPPLPAECVALLTPTCPAPRKDVRVPAELKGMFMTLTQGLSHILSTLIWHLISTSKQACRAVKKLFSVKSGVNSPPGCRDADFGPDVSFLLAQGWVGFAV